MLVIAQIALDVGQSLIHPYAFRKTLEIISFDKGNLRLEEEINIQNTHISELMCGAEVVEAYKCTISDQLEKASAALFPTNPSLTLALDGKANAVIDLPVIKLVVKWKRELKNLM